jgi:tRNA-dihydrouridine synthase
VVGFITGEVRRVHRREGVASSAASGGMVDRAGGGGRTVETAVGHVTASPRVTCTLLLRPREPYSLHAQLSRDDCPIFVDLVCASTKAWLEKLHALLEATVLYSELNYCE